MECILLVPKVVQNYIGQFPEVRHNAYRYFNYDNRIVNERVNRFDQKPPYKGPEALNNSDYDALVTYAKTLINPILAKYSMRVANEDALHIAIRSFSNGFFDSKISASKFEVLVKSMTLPAVSISPSPCPCGVMAKKDKKPEKKEKPIVIKPHVLKQLGLTPKEIPMRQTVKKVVQRGKAPLIVREKGKHIIKK